MTTDAAVDVGELEDSRLYSVKKRVDDLLVIVLPIIPIYLYLEFLASSANPLYTFKPHLQYLLLAYFAGEILLSFFLYETHREFLRDRWMDILLTIPFLKAGKALFGGMKALQMGKAVKLGRGGKAALVKGTKLTQKASKFVLKGRKVRKKRNQDGPADDQRSDADEP